MESLTYLSDVTMLSVNQNRRRKSTGSKSSGAEIKKFRAIVATVATPASDMNDCEVCLVAQRDARRPIALVPCGTSVFVRLARTTWNVRDVDVPSTAQTSK